MLRSPPPVLASLATIGLSLPLSRCLIGSPSLSSSGSLPKVPRVFLARFYSLAGTKGATNIFKSRSLSILANQSSVLAPEVSAKAEEIPLLTAVKGNKRCLD
ncbi:hypothetical protein OPV22_008707 [Ensete ventricosum]|uniref:Uncharacterized protein n=1 Tax=Ensete ventricosum TaxID=4639 RepID=A0AAV8PXE1_ENSVE|nr:hypothetical protein OPV22_008707 [Ensete ventricosum]